jgi:hypothetical protein
VLLRKRFSEKDKQLNWSFKSIDNSGVDNNLSFRRDSSQMFDIKKET